MSNAMDGDPPTPEWDRSELLDLLRRTMVAAGLDAGADVRDLPARVADLRRQAQAPPRQDPWADVPGPGSLPQPGPGENPPETPGWPRPPIYT